MPKIILQTLIKADQATCFDASRSIDVHVSSMVKSKEKAIGGTTTGLIGLHETVTWKAKHLGIWWTLTTRITQMDEPNSFTDEIVSGPFATMHHKHIFIAVGKQTCMIDEFTFSSPLGLLGKFATWLFVKKYMYKLLSERNEWVKIHAQWLAGLHRHDDGTT